MCFFSGVFMAVDGCHRVSRSFAVDGFFHRILLTLMDFREPYRIRVKQWLPLMEFRNAWGHSQNLCWFLGTQQVIHAIQPLFESRAPPPPYLPQSLSFLVPGFPADRKHGQGTQGTGVLCISLVVVCIGLGLEPRLLLKPKFWNCPTSQAPNRQGASPKECWNPGLGIQVSWTETAYRPLTTLSDSPHFSTFKEVRFVWEETFFFKKKAYRSESIPLASP